MPIETIILSKSYMTLPDHTSVTPFLLPTHKPPQPHTTHPSPADSPSQLPISHSSPFTSSTPSPFDSHQDHALSPYFPNHHLPYSHPPFPISHLFPTATPPHPTTQPHHFHSRRINAKMVFPFDHSRVQFYFIF